MTPSIMYADYEVPWQMRGVLAGESGYSQCFDEGAWVELLKLVGSGSAGVVTLAVDYPPILPLVGSSSFIDDRRTARVRAPKLAESEVSAEFQELVSLPVVEQMKEVCAALSLNKSQLAQVFGVTRPTIYAWFRDKDPNPENTARLHKLLRVLARASVSGARPLNARFVRQSVKLDAPSILELLTADELDEKRIVQALERARALAEEAARRRTNREERLRELGFEEPTGSERREQLARNMALKDWHK